jgi:hypothetical protein
LVGHRIVFHIHDPVWMDYPSHYHLEIGSK